MNAMGVAGRGKRQNPNEFYKELCVLTTAGVAAFWVTTIATSLLPVAAKYRGAFSNWSVHAVWAGSLPAGMVIACCVSYALLRLFERIPAKNPILKSMVLSATALAVAIVLVDVPMIFRGSSDALYYFSIGVVFNAARFLFLGITVGYLYERLYG